jgi:hypothetical protein
MKDYSMLVESLYSHERGDTPPTIEAANAITALQARVAELEVEISARSDLMQGYLDCWRNDKARAERAEADLAAARALLKKAQKYIYTDTILYDRIDAALAGKDTT